MLRQEPKAVGKARLDIPGMVNRADNGDLIIKKNPGLLAIINSTHRAGNDVAQEKDSHPTPMKVHCCNTTGTLEL